eukprot:PhM_4_TR16196/c0_g1_i1/m.68866/K14803/PTC2_3; protein phosphatase PTC2/3
MGGKKGGANKTQQQQNKSEKKEKKSKSEDFDALMAQLAAGTARTEPTQTVTNEDAKARRKKKAQQLREAKEEHMGEDELMRRVEQQRQHQQLQQIMQMLQQSAGRSEILDVPEKKKEPLEDKQDADVSVALCGMQGWRRSMEDAHTAELALDGGHKYFAVFDGHVGRQCADHLSATLAKRVAATAEFKKGEYKEAFTKAYLAADDDLRKHDEGSGCTAVSCLLTPKNSVVCANVGDSRAVLCRGGEALALSEDHKPQTPAEEERIKKAGGHVSMNRVNGQLAMSRAMGDFTYKTDATLGQTEQQVIPLPDVVEVPLTKADEFLIVACDGVWDVLSNEEAVSMVRALLKEGKAPRDIVQEIAERCCCPPAPTGGPTQGLGTDNITVIVVVFKDEYRAKF